MSKLWQLVWAGVALYILAHIVIALAIKLMPVLIIGVAALVVHRLFFRQRW